MSSTNRVRIQIELNATVDKDIITKLSAVSKNERAFFLRSIIRQYFNIPIFAIADLSSAQKLPDQTKTVQEKTPEAKQPPSEKQSLGELEKVSTENGDDELALLGNHTQGFFDK
jgi:hypothetical protein